MTSAIIFGAVIVGGGLALFAFLHYLGSLSIARATSRVANALFERNKIEAKKMHEELDAFRRGIMYEVGDQTTRALDQVRGEVADLAAVLGVEVVAGKLEWRHEGGLDGRTTSGVTVVTAAESVGGSYGDHTQGSAEQRRVRRFDDITPTMVVGIGAIRTLGFDVRAGVEGVMTYMDMPREFQNVQHPGQIAEEDRLRQKLWDWILHWMAGRGLPVTSAAPPWEPYPDQNYSWYDAFRSMLIQVYGFGLFPDIRDQFPSLNRHPEYLEFRDRYHLDDQQ